MKILFVATEVHPFIRTGGLGDVVGALSKKISSMGNDVRVILPKYKGINDKFKNDMTHVTDFIVNVGWRKQYCGIEMLKYEGVTFYFIDNEYYFNRDGVLYGHYDDAERFAFFDRAVLEALKNIDWCPNVMQTNDWQCGMIPALYKLEYCKDDFYKNSNMKIVYTIHNLLFQGIFGKEILGELFSYDLEQYNNGILRFDDGVSFMKGGIHYCDKVTTVSDTYAQEIKTPYYGERLDAVLRGRENDLVGILNGIDYEEYNPETDEYLSAKYTATSIEKKYENKVELQRELGLKEDKDIPVISLISRLTSQKGIDLILNESEFLLSRNVQLVILGTGDKHFENEFKKLEDRYPDKVRVRLAFDTALSHRIYAGSDIFLMPSAFEPCGLGQLIALRYGTIPVVRETGGLKDTIDAYNKYFETGNGFSFKNYWSYEFMKALEEALEVYADKNKWNKLVLNAMDCDNSWNFSALKYMEIYKNL